ncbi:MAG: YafY family protein [Clostridium sp.]
MKIERLIGIVFYLLNRESVTANQLAEKFQVSRRTILRDIDTLTLAGIPIYSEAGVKGGYAISKEFKVNEKIIDSRNSEYMLLALQSLKSVYGNKKVEETYEKVRHIYPEKEASITPEIDFSVVKENEIVIEAVSRLKEAIQQSKVIDFIYTNSKGESRRVYLKPLHIYYKWYSWYIFGYDFEKKSFRVFKVVRIEELKVTNETFINDYDVEALLSQLEKEGYEDNLQVTLKYLKEINPLINEYFLGNILEEDSRFITRVVEIKDKDFMSFSIILGFGDKVEVLSPKAYRERIINHSQRTLINYIENSDI